MAATAPSPVQWAAIIRRQNAVHRKLGHKIRLRDPMQEQRKREHERLRDDYKASFRRNRSDSLSGESKKDTKSGEQTEDFTENTGGYSKSGFKTNSFLRSKYAKQSEKISEN